ncbi:hypothetical protein [Streptomyces canus]|uniref:hypothetical protein n=1 Tax=Streptomyces canus TaxID=58343 RepID=UPI0033A87D23
MSEFIQQLPALIGALGSYVVVVRGDRVRFQREQAARWEERKLTVYGEYARTLKKSVTPTYGASIWFTVVCDDIKVPGQGLSRAAVRSRL